jgi:hypothetical protein
MYVQSGWIPFHDTTQRDKAIYKKKHSTAYLMQFLSIFFFQCLYSLLIITTLILRLHSIIAHLNGPWSPSNVGYLIYFQLITIIYLQRQEAG